MDLNGVDYELGLFLASAPSGFPEASSCQIQSSSAADLSPKREVKGARRVRNACLQCRERKIRCSRTYPCKGCLSRGDGAACDWQGGFPTGNIPIYQKHAADQRRQIEKLKDRLTCAKACLGSVFQNNSNLKIEVGHRQTRPPFILPITPREGNLSWFPTGSNEQTPGSALSNISSFSTNTVDSSQGWSHEDATSPLSADVHATIWKERNPSRVFEMRHKTTGYRPLSLLREEDGLDFEGSRPYTAGHEDLTRASVSDGQDNNPTTCPTTFDPPDLPWSDSLSPNLEQRIQAYVNLGLMNVGEQYSFLPSGFSLAPTAGSSQAPMYNSNLSANWPPAPP
ncbi:hypothetical protein PtA15_16A124 [Puccinia triticina]|uniref:Zn(2)-C6 fungal-type domain-containing protein n=1 Tax=Puccinia triticina TaxID=208348 RepID=A0ABY7D6J5_9BASI|nr:uncharacterized protein PtA15_16A124 [Puccinia triticina]WAQ92218.1 hypothetical protein PtA15_16A124 [Puccinia triticina]